MSQPLRIVVPSLVVRPAVPAILDLHGLFIHDAYHATVHFLADVRRRGYRVATVITGRSGQIYREFVHWLDAVDHVATVVETGSGGAFRIVLTR